MLVTAQKMRALDNSGRRAAGMRPLRLRLFYSRSFERRVMKKYFVLDRIVEVFRYYNLLTHCDGKPQ